MYDKGIQALGYYTLPGTPLPVEACNQIDYGTFVDPLHKLLGLGQQNTLQ